MLVRTSKLLDLTERVQKSWSNGTLPSLDAAARLCRGTAIQTTSDLAGELGEAIVRHSVEEIARELPYVRMDPVKPGDKSDQYIFKNDGKGHLVAVSKWDGLEQAEFDLVLIVDGIPTLFEVKTGQHKVNRVMQRKHYERKLAPLADRFRAEFLSYVVVAPPEFLVFDAMLERNFVKNGGCLLPFYKGCADYGCDVLRVDRLLKSKRAV